MDCDRAREAISALLDGEPPLVRSSELEQHLAGCTGCRVWREAAHQVTREVRLQLATPIPAPTREVLTALGRAFPARRRIHAAMLARAGLVLVAAGQIAISLPMLLFGSDHEAPMHVAHEMGSFDLALAVGFLVAAWRPTRAVGMRSLVGAAAALLVLTAVIDLLGGRTSLPDEAPHLLAVAGWLLLCELAARTPPAQDQRSVSVLGVIALAIRRVSLRTPELRRRDDAMRVPVGPPVEDYPGQRERQDRAVGG